jgi:hypothetical protein
MASTSETLEDVDKVTFKKISQHFSLDGEGTAVKETVTPDRPGIAWVRDAGADVAKNESTLCNGRSK